RRRKRIVKRSFTFIVVYLIFSLISVPLRSADETFFNQARREVEKSLKGRQGLALWIDRETQEKHLWGDAVVAQEFFRPGSLMKLIVAEAALRKRENLDYECRGHERFEDGTLFCWKRSGHGSLDLPKALSISCNLYFASLSGRVGAQEIVSSLRRYGFSKARALSPSLFSSRELRFLAVGDSPEFHVTPAEMAGFWDHYLKHLEDPALSAVKQGLSRASVEGTASKGGRGGLEILAKTGTSDSELKTYRAHGWFLGAYPADRPRFALIVFLKDAYGFREAAELGRGIFNLW